MQSCEPRLDFLEQSVLLGDLPIDISLVGDNPALLHLRSGHAHVNGRYLLNALPLVAAMVDALMNTVSLQRLIRPFCPSRSPFLGFGLLVPVGEIDPVIFPAAFPVRDALTALVKIILLPAFCIPLPVCFEWTNC